jgi:hypothetical protein
VIESVELFISIPREAQPKAYFGSGSAMLASSARKYPFGDTKTFRESSFVLGDAIPRQTLSILRALGAKDLVYQKGNIYSSVSYLGALHEFDFVTGRPPWKDEVLLAGILTERPFRGLFGRGFKQSPYPQIEIIALAREGEIVSLAPS